jgi:hypothetical protein
MRVLLSTTYGSRVNLKPLVATGVMPAGVSL